MKHTEKKYSLLAVWLLCMATAIVGCTTEDLQSVGETAQDMELLVYKSRAAEAKTPTATSEKEEIEEYLRTLNGDFEEGTVIRLVNNLIGKVPDFTKERETGGRKAAGYFAYKCVTPTPDDTTSAGYYKFEPVDVDPVDVNKDKKFVWAPKNTPEDKLTPQHIFTNGSYYAFNALYYRPYEKGESGFKYIKRVGINDTSGKTNGIYGIVRKDQHTEALFRATDIMQAHHLKDRRTEYGTVIKLQFYHQLSMIVIHISVPKQTNGVGFTKYQMDHAACYLTGFYPGFVLPYNMDFDSDGYMATDKDPDEAKIDQISMWALPEGGAREEMGKDGKVYYVRTYAALVPKQEKQDKLCRFTIGGKNYGYSPIGNVELSPASMTIINLRIDPNKNEPILIKTQIQPWSTAYVPNFPLYPENNTPQE